MSHLTLVNNATPKTTRKVRKSEPAIPLPVARALKQLESGDVDLVCLIASSNAENRVYQVTAGKGAGFLQGLSLPYISQNPLLKDGNVVTLRPQLDKLEQLWAIARAFASGNLDAMHLLVGRPGCKAEHRRFQHEA